MCQRHKSEIVDATKAFLLLRRKRKRERRLGETLSTLINGNQFGKVFKPWKILAFFQFLAAMMDTTLLGQLALHNICMVHYRIETTGSPRAASANPKTLIAVGNSWILFFKDGFHLHGPYHSWQRLLVLQPLLTSKAEYYRQFLKSWSFFICA